MKTKIKNNYKSAVKRAMTGETNGRDLIHIVKYQNRDLGEINDVNAATLVLYQVAFN